MDTASKGPGRLQAMKERLAVTARLYYANRKSSYSRHSRQTPHFCPEAEANLAECKATENFLKVGLLYAL